MFTQMLQKQPAAADVRQGPECGREKGLCRLLILVTHTHPALADADDDQQERVKIPFRKWTCEYEGEAVMTDEARLINSHMHP